MKNLFRIFSVIFFFCINLFSASSFALQVETPDSVRGIYMTSWIAGSKEFRIKLVNLIKETELNTVVIDVKDYTGIIPFKVSNPKLRGIGSVEPRMKDIKEFIKFLNEEGIYVIARIVVFQDLFLSESQPDLAVKKKNGEVWKDHRGIGWLNPCSKEVWDYTIRVAKEAIKLGFDELNFDYVRFPGSGSKELSEFCCWDRKPEVIEDFFIYLDSELEESSIPLSVDLFGLVTESTNDLNVGQVLEKAAPYFDYICPMVYPSHYEEGHRNYKNPALYPYEVVNPAMRTASERLVAIGYKASKLRPWLQDFSIRGVVYTREMVQAQIKAVYDANPDLVSWMLWNPRNIYTKKALKLADVEACNL